MLYQGPLKERFSRAPFVQYNKGDTWGLVGFDKSLSEEEISYVKEHIKTLGSKEITWTLPGGKRRLMLRSHHDLTARFFHSLSRGGRKGLPAAARGVCRETRAAFRDTG